MSDTLDTRVRKYVQRLKKEYGYPADSIRTEVLFSKGMARYELDVIVYLKGQPYIVIEVKKDIEDKRGIEQLKKYSRIGNKFAVLTNGFRDSCFEVSKDNLKIQLIKISDIPKYGQSLEDIGKQQYSELVEIGQQRFKIVLRSLLKELCREIGSPIEALKGLSLVLLAKLEDEHNRHELFRFSYEEPKDKVKARLLRLIEYIHIKNPELDTNLWIKAEPLTRIVSTIQKFRLSPLSERHELSILLENGFKEIYAENYTPRAINQFIVELLSLVRGKEFLDPACGLGGLIYEAAQKGVKVIGYEKNVDVGTIAQINLLLSDLDGNVHIKDSLQYPKPNKKFDYVALVPPFEKFVIDSNLSYFRVARSRKSQNSEDLFIELALFLTKPEGKIAVVVPNRVLFSYLSKETRLLITEQSNVKAIIELPNTAFEPYSRVKTSLLILEKSEKPNINKQDKVFVSRLDSMNETTKILKSYLSFEKSGKLEETENIFTSFIETAEQWDTSYLKGLRFLKNFDKIETVELGQIADITAGTSIKSIGVVSKNGNVPYLKGGNVLQWRIDIKNAVKLEAFENISRWVALPNDILMTRAGTVGRAAIVEDNFPKMVVGTNLVRIRVRKQAPLLPEYIVAYLNSRQGKKQISMFSGGSTVKSINMAELGKIKIPLISIEKQKEIARELQNIMLSINEAEDLLNERRKKLKKFSDNLGNRVMGS